MDCTATSCPHRQAGEQEAMSRISAQRIREGDIIPRLSAVAWFNPDSMSYTVLPIPFHWPARWMRGLWYYVKCGYRPGVIERVSQNAYRTGLQAGYDLRKHMLVREFQKGSDYGMELGITYKADIALAAYPIEAAYPQPEKEANDG